MKNELNISNKFLKYGEYIRVGNNSKEFDPRQIDSIFTLEPEIFLTFDICPSRKLSKDVIDFLIKNKIQATFFVNVQWYIQNKSRLDFSFLDNPLFSIGAHGYYHIDPMLQSEEEQIEDMNACLNFWNKEGRKIKWYRVPHGHPTETNLRFFETHNIKCASWKSRIFDKEYRYTEEVSIEHVKAYIENQIQSGDILLLHANGKGINTFEILKLIVNACSTIGFGFRKLT